VAKNQNRLPFELDSKLDDSLITAYAGLPLVVEMFRAAGGAAETDRLLRHKKKALGPGRYVPLWIHLSGEEVVPQSAAH